MGVCLLGGCVYCTEYLYFVFIVDLQSIFEKPHYFLNSPVRIAQWAHMHCFPSVLYVTKIRLHHILLSIAARQC